MKILLVVTISRKDNSETVDWSSELELTRGELTLMVTLRMDTLPGRRVRGGTLREDTTIYRHDS